MSALVRFERSCEPFVICVLCGAFLFVLSVRASAASLPPELSKPTIFWHNNEWEIFTNGTWMAYTSARQAEGVTQTTQPSPASAESSFGPPFESTVSDTLNGYPADAEFGGSYGYYGVPYITIGPDWFRHRRSFRNGHRLHIPGTTIRHPVAALGAANTSIGSPNVGIGQPNVAIARRTIGIGNPTIGIGQPNGIGQTTIGIGQPLGFDRGSDARGHRR